MKIGIIKLGAKGDVLRTLPILIALKQKYPSSEIYWFTKPACKEILERSPYIDKIITIPTETTFSFDMLYNFDIEDLATNLATKIVASKKYGFISENGYPLAINFQAEYYLNTLFDDELKKSNKKTYQEMMFDAAELPYRKEYHPLHLSEKDIIYGKKFLADNNLEDKKLLGIHIGSSPRWPSKRWHLDNLKDFIILAKDKGYEIILFSGPDETEQAELLVNSLEEAGLNIFRNEPKNSDGEFFSLINLCDKIVCGDTFALHVAIAFKKPTYGLFFCTSPDEVEGYGYLRKIISPRLYDFFPERSDEYSEELTKSISPRTVLEKINNE